MYSDICIILSWGIIIGGIMSNQVSIQASEIESIVSSFQKASTSINSGVSEKIKTGFKGLTECDLFSDGLDILISNAEQVSQVLNSISASISNHLGGIQSLEDNNSGRIRDYGSGAGPGSYVQTPPEEISVIEGIAINLANTEKDSLSNLIHNIDKLKGEISLDDILFNNDNNSKLIKILKEQLGLEGDFSEEEIMLIKKALINKMFETDLENEELKLNTVYMLKEFLVDFAKENNITVGDLLVDPKYEKIYKVLLSEIYRREITNDRVSTEEMNNIRSYIVKALIVKQKEGGPNVGVLYG